MEYGLIDGGRGGGVYKHSIKNLLSISVPTEKSFFRHPDLSGLRVGIWTWLYKSFFWNITGMHWNVVLFLLDVLQN